MPSDSPLSNGFATSRSPRHRDASRSRSRSKTPKSSRRRRSRSRSRDEYSRRSGGNGRSYGFRRSRDGPRENPEPSRCLGIFGLSLRTQERDLYDLFSRYGEVEDVSIVYDNYNGRSRGFGFIYFRHLNDAKEAKNEVNGLDLDGRAIRCDFSVTERPHSPTPGIYMGRPTRRFGSRRRTPSPRHRYSRSVSRSRS